MSFNRFSKDISIDFRGTQFHFWSEFMKPSNPQTVRSNNIVIHYTIDPGCYKTERYVVVLTLILFKGAESFIPVPSVQETNFVNSIFV